MDVDRQGIRLEYEDLRCVELPKEVLYDVVIVLDHAADGGADRLLEDALRPLAGEAERRRIPLLGPDLRFRKGAYNLDIRLRDGSARIEARNRLQPRAIERLVAALTGLPGANGLQIEATVPHYSKSLSSLRACTPCQASRLR